MYEIDFLPVGDGARSGDAIAMRFAHNGSWVVVVIDGGFQPSGKALVEHVKTHYQTSVVDLAILTHPDGDHIGGMGEILQGLDVKELWLQNPSSHGGSSLRAAKAVDDLLSRAETEGTETFEIFAGAQAFDGAITILGPESGYYEELVADQVVEEAAQTRAVAGVGKALVEAASSIWDRAAVALGFETPFLAGDVNARNNSSTVTLLSVEDQAVLFTADAGVEALDRAWDLAEQLGRATRPELVQVPHHGSRRNASSAWLDRILGPVNGPQSGSAIVSVVENHDKHPSGRVVNAYRRRGYPVTPTAGRTICHVEGTPMRYGWVSVDPLPPMTEEEDE